MKRLVVHLIDASADTAYFRSIVRHSDPAHFPVAIGSLAGLGTLQESMAQLAIRSFALGAGRRLGYPVAAARLAWRLRSWGAGLLHAHCFDATAVGLLAARLARVPFVFTRHHSDHNLRLGKKWHTRVDAFCARHADRVIAVSEATRRVLVDVEGVPTSRVTVVYNGMEPQTPVDASVVSDVRRALRIDDGVRVCLTVARLHEEKGHSVLFHAVPQIVEDCGATVFLLAGDGPHRSVMEREVRNLGVDEHVRFLGRRPDVPALLALADVAVLPSLAESFGFAALEAMDLGVPVVASTTGGLPEVVSEGVTGLLAPTGDASALAAAVVRVLKDRDLAAALGRAGRERSRFFTAERMLRGYQAVYRTLWTAEGWEAA
jgi:glycosyltransferase involved in cell wall biosynthesis